MNGEISVVRVHVVNMPVVSPIFVICDERFKRWLHQDEHKNIDRQL